MLSRHVLVVLGGVKGLEFTLSCCSDLQELEDVSLLFHHYLNVCPQQGSRTIRTEVEGVNRLNNLEVVVSDVGTALIHTSVSTSCHMLSIIIFFFPLSVPTSISFCSVSDFGTDVWTKVVSDVWTRGSVRCMD